jgi:hypothetical protein
LLFNERSLNDLLKAFPVLFLLSLSPYKQGRWKVGLHTTSPCSVPRLNFILKVREGKREEMERKGSKAKECLHHALSCCALEMKKK